MPSIIKIARFAYEPDCTLGVMTIPGTDFECYTIERPWVFNTPGKSCIWEGEYAAHIGWHYGKGARPYPCPALSGVAGRTDIQIHIANKSSELRGCIAPGFRLGISGGERAVLESRAAFGVMIGHLTDPDSPRLSTLVQVIISNDLERFRAYTLPKSPVPDAR